MCDSPPMRTVRATQWWIISMAVKVAGAYSGISMARYAGTLDKTVVALNRFGSIAKPVNPEAGTKPKLLGNEGVKPSSARGIAAQAIAEFNRKPLRGRMTTDPDVYPLAMVEHRTTSPRRTRNHRSVSLSIVQPESD